MNARSCIAAVFQGVGRQIVEELRQKRLVSVNLWKRIAADLGAGSWIDNQRPWSASDKSLYLIFNPPPSPTLDEADDSARCIGGSLLSLFAAGDSGWRAGGSDQANRIRFDLPEGQMLHRGWLCRRESEEDADRTSRAGQVELPA